MGPAKKLGLMLVVLMLILSVLSVAAQGDADEATDMFAAMNAWRLEQGLSPFAYNPTLEALATLQLYYLLALDNLPDAIHRGMLGEGPRDRARWFPYNWPTYGNDARINLVEVVVAAQDIPAGITWWQGSSVHNRAITNPAYREIGVAALPYAYGTVYVAVLGGRPNVLPALVYPDGESISLTRDGFYGATGNDFINGQMLVRLLDANQEPITDYRPWQATLPITPMDAPFFVEYTNGNQTVLSPVDPAQDQVILPGYTPTVIDAVEEPAVDGAGDPQSFDIEGALIEVVTDQPNALTLYIQSKTPLYIADFELYALHADRPPDQIRFPDVFDGMRYASPGTCYTFSVIGAAFELPKACTGLVVSHSIPAAEAFWYDFALEQQNPIIILDSHGGLLAECNKGEQCLLRVSAVAASAGVDGAVVVPVSREVRIEYNDWDFAVINNGGEYLSLADVSFETSGQKISASDIWGYSPGSSSLYFFPGSGCLQTWANDVPVQPKPGACKVRHAWVTLNPTSIFWREGFDVLLGGTILTTCLAEESDCTFVLP